MYRILCSVLLAWGCWGPAFSATFTFSAPPDLDVAESRTLFEPFMALLGRETGDSFVHIHPDSGFDYRDGMRAGRYHLLLDDAHYAGWRISALGHVPVVRARTPLAFVAVATRAGTVYSREDLVGQPVCAKPPPDLGAVGFLRQFDGLFQVPQMRATPDPLDRIQGLLTGKCAGAVLARHVYTGSVEIRRVAGQLKIVSQTESYPGLTLTAGPDVPEHLRRRIRAALLSRAGDRATRVLRDRLAGGSDFVAAAPGDYEGLARLLHDYPGFRD